MSVRWIFGTFTALALALDCLLWDFLSSYQQNPVHAYLYVGACACLQCLLMSLWATYYTVVCISLRHQELTPDLQIYQVISYLQQIYSVFS